MPSPISILAHYSCLPSPGQRGTQTEILQGLYLLLASQGSEGAEPGFLGPYEENSGRSKEDTHGKAYYYISSMLPRGQIETLVTRPNVT